ncbi:putative MFS-type transporter [Cyphellophora attinorum]|uniref:Putative MFS-type transporter n=1 Tax=Cyphellophora attinorum TaxID=1664694 RepID=A0A0N1H4W0_9EURO|nr:putative MFS-type transporter [Phialophora attinorum]KPI36534.1 putative MFS-type transporter [Phialophora attinorum]
MDFPGIEKCYSHVSVPRRRSSDSSSSSSDITPTSALHEQYAFASDTKALTPVSSRVSRPPVSRQLTRVTTAGTTMTLDPAYEIDFEVDDPRDPRNWALWYKALVMFSISYSTLIVVLYSTSYTAAIAAMSEEFNITDDAITTLGVTTYLIGLACGSLVLAPISETYGRKPVYAIAMFVFVVLVIPCALAKDITTIIVVRFFGACAGASMIANAPGTVGDVISDKYRATAFSIWSIGPMNGPVFGPLIGGFTTQEKGWRWANWVVMIGGGAAFLMMVIIPETYKPTLLQKMAAKKRKETGDDSYWSRYDVRVGFGELMRVNLSRPFVMAVKEPICIFWNVYIAIIYGILYLCFVAYPIVFVQERGWSIGMSGLSFLGIGIGTMITICCAKPIRLMIERHKPDPVTGEVPPESMMSVVCIAAVLIPVGELWFAWTCYPTSISPYASIAAGIPFGAGNGAVFIYASNYLVHSYGIYAASAMAGNAVVRSFMGGTLPLAGPALYRALGPNWAGTLLGGLEILILPIPFIFYRYGGKLRLKSTLIREMREEEERQERKKKKALERIEREERRRVLIEGKGREDVEDTDGESRPSSEAGGGALEKETGIVNEQSKDANVPSVTVSGSGSSDWKEKDMV